MVQVTGPDGEMTWQAATPSLAWSQVPSCWTRGVVSGTHIGLAGLKCVLLCQLHYQAWSTLSFSAVADQ